MCGRFTLTRNGKELADHFGLAHCPDLTPQSNIVPGGEIAVIGLNKEGQRVSGMMRWGLIPHWSKAIPQYPTHNARAESAAEKPSFREAFARRRCLIPADGWYEWQRENGHAVPWLVRHQDGTPLAFAGLWERWHHDGRTILSTTILTRQATADLATLHPRMPVLVRRADFAAWLSPETPQEQILAITAKEPDGPFILQACNPESPSAAIT